MFGTPQVHRVGKKDQIKSVQNRVQAVKSRWDAEERELRKKIAERRMQQLICLLSLSQPLETARI